MKFDFRNIDRRIIYLLILIVLGVPIATGYTLKPSKLEAGSRMYRLIENVDPSSGIAFVAMDFGPNTKAENESQAEVLVEHLFRRRMPVAVFSLYAQAQDFLESVPNRVARRLAEEFPGQKWEYGRDWVNLGYKAGMSMFVQSIPKSDNIAELFGKDVFGAKLADLPVFKNVRKFEDIKLLGEFTGLVGLLDIYIQYFQKQGYVPPIVHGCTSITIPEAYNYLDSGQLSGLLEGLAGAAWYSELLSDNNPEREPDTAALMNTALGVGHLAIIFLVIFGNLAALSGKGKKK